MTLKEACNIVHNKMVNVTILSGVEFKDVFAFNLVPKNSIGDGFANSCSYVVYKNGKEPEYVNMFEINKRMHNPNDIIQIFEEIE